MPKVKEGKPTDFIPDKHNANQGTQRGQKMIQDSLQEDGAARSVVVDKNNNVVAGNRTLESAVDIGIDKAIIVETTGNELVVTKRTDWDLYEDESPRRYAYRDNRSGEVSLKWSPTQLLLDKEAGIDFGGLFYDNELDAITAEVRKEPSEVDPPSIDKADELQKKWQVKEGDIWQIESVSAPGRYHRLICGDCRNSDDLAALLDEKKANGIFTSPPYAMQRTKQYGGTPTNEYVEWWEGVQAGMRGVLTKDGSFFVNIKPHCEDKQRSLYVMDLVLAMVRRWDWRFVDEFCWLGTAIPISVDGRFKNGFEPVFHFSRGSVKFRAGNVSVYSRNVPYIPPSGSVHLDGVSGGIAVSSHTKSGLARPSNVVGAYSGEPGHAASFPLKLPTFFVKAFSNKGDIWLDPFCGGGTVLAACENEGRVGYGMEILPKYCGVILQRMSDMGLTVCFVGNIGVGHNTTS